MYCAVPVIVSRADGLIMQVRDGINGFVTDNDPASLSTCIDRALQLTEMDYLAMSHEAMLSNRQYSLSKICDELLSIYKGEHA
jgi:glycosyltransferase involved in cell wall biosynthesis